jgi:hypothetical protein
MARESNVDQPKSAWGRAPIPAEESVNDGGKGPIKKSARARAIAEEVGAAIKGGIAPVTDRVGSAMRSGLGSVEHALEDPTGAMHEELREQADLPEIEGEDPLASTGLRLDREADLWRGVAMRQLARAAWMDRLAITSAVVVLIGEIVLASVAGFRALFASEAVSAVSVLLGVGALLLIAGTTVISRAAGRVRESQLEVARGALARADLAELRLHRLAALMELRKTDRDAYLAALRGLEADVRRA